MTIEAIAAQALAYDKKDSIAWPIIRFGGNHASDSKRRKTEKCYCRWDAN
jgi:hypothetical protein